MQILGSIFQGKEVRLTGQKTNLFLKVQTLINELCVTHIHDIRIWTSHYFMYKYSIIFTLNSDSVFKIVISNTYLFAVEFIQSKTLYNLKQSSHNALHLFLCSRVV
jgi:hypothetical protein